MSRWRRHAIRLRLRTRRRIWIVPKRWCERRTRRAPRSSCCRSCSRRPISVSSRTPRYLQWAQSLEDSSLLRRFGALAGELGRRPADQLLRAGRQCLLQFPGTVRCRRHPFWAAIGNRTYRTARAIRRSFTSSPGDTGFRVWDTRYGRLGCRHMLGSVVSRECARHGATGCGTAAVSPPPSAASRRRHRPLTPGLHWQRTQQGHAAANLMPLIASQPRRRGALAAESAVAAPALLRFLVHRRRQRRPGSRGRPGQPRPSSPPASSWMRCGVRARTGSYSAIAARISMHR